MLLTYPAGSLAIPAASVRYCPARLAGDPFHIAILDHEMPGMDGQSLARNIKADPDLKDVLLVMLSSRGLRGDAKRMEEAGFSAYLTKCARPSTILNVLTAIWARSQHGSGPLHLITRHSLAESGKDPRTSLPLLPSSARVRVLVVEDNAVNQLVAPPMLERLGCHVDLAVDGKKAVAAVESQPYDLVFMDCQMPVMDGFQATREIRRVEPAGTHRIIIAMTAGAMQGDRERCLEAGMDDYVSKPINKTDVAKNLDALYSRMASTRTLASSPDQNLNRSSA